MASQTVQDQIQALPVTKRMLGMAEAEPLSCAFALTRDKKECVLLVAKTGGSKKAATALKADGKAFIDPQTLRFGRVSFNMPSDPGTVVFTINRAEAGGTLIHLNKLVKRSGYQGLVINPDESLEDEVEGGAEGDAAAPPPASAAPDADALKKRLTTLVQRATAAIAGGTADRNTVLSLAKEAQQLLAAGNLPNAANAMDRLEAALAVPDPATTAAKGAVAYAKSRLVWIAASRKVAADIAKLRAALQDRYGHYDNAAAIADLYEQRVSPVLRTFDEQLADTLDEVTNATDPGVREKLVGDVRRRIEDHQAFLESEPLIAALDDNPFVKLSVAATMKATLTALAASVH